MPFVRPMAVGGTWYPADAARLAREVDAYLSRVGERVEHPRALVVPHAGLVYSGPVAAFAYAAVRDGTYTAAVLVGPSHYVPFSGVSVWPRGAWQTPLGPVAVDEALAASIAASSTWIVDRPDAHGREHSLEMQLPFVAHVLPGVPIVPLVMGDQSRDVAFELGDAIAAAVSPRADDVLLIASSDLSHFADATTAARLDDVVTAAIDRLDPDGLMTALEREPGHACGGGAIVAVLHAARRLGARQASVLRYADSGDVSGDKSSVVGYLAGAAW